MNKGTTVAVLMVLSFLIGSALSWSLQGSRAEKERGDRQLDPCAVGVAACLRGRRPWRSGRGSACHVAEDPRDAYD